jgi:electron transport complex protein RnfE
MEKPADIRSIAREGLWTRNQALVALLGLCPLLAVSNSVVNGLGLGLATTAALVLSNGLVSLVRKYIVRDVRLPAFVLIIASTVTAIDLAMNAWLHDLHRILGIFIPLIVTNCAIMGRAEAFASRNPPKSAILDGLFAGLGFTGALVALGAVRELLGCGTLLGRADLLFGEAARSWAWQPFHDYGGFLLAILPPGAFIGLGLLIALKNLIDDRTLRTRPADPPEARFTRTGSEFKP